MASNVAAVVVKLQASLSYPSQYGGIGPTPVPDNAELPYITVQQINESELSSHDGRSHVGPCIIQVNCFDKSYETAEGLRRLVKGALLDLSGTFSGVVIQGCNYVSGHELYDSERELHQLIGRFKIWFES